MAVLDTFLFDTVRGESLERLMIENEDFYYGIAPAEKVSEGILLLIHGIASNASRWEEFTENSTMRQSWTFVRTDLRGHGGNESDVPGTLERFADDIAFLIKELNEKRECPVVIVGHSLGAQIALATAVRHPDLVDGIILLDPLVTEALTPVAIGKRRWLPIFRLAEVLLRYCNRLGFRRKLCQYNLRREDERARRILVQGGDAVKKFIKSFSSPRSDLTHIHTAVYLRDFLEVSRPTPVPESILCPTLVIGSSSGVFTDPARMTVWTRKLPDGEFAVVHCAHWPMTECPEEVARTIEGWMGRHFPTESDR